MLATLPVDLPNPFHLHLFFPYGWALALYAPTPPLRCLVDSLSPNSGSVDGGAIHTAQGPRRCLVRLAAGTRLVGNFANMGSGGGVYVRAGDLKIEETVEFADNSAGLNGGAVTVLQASGQNMRGLSYVTEWGAALARSDSDIQPT
jgi:hypothetical protein